MEVEAKFNHNEYPPPVVVLQQPEMVKWNITMDWIPWHDVHWEVSPPVAIITLIIAVALVYLIRSLVLRMILTLYWRSRGMQYVGESMRVGSSFSKTHIPRWQLQVFKQGLFSLEHVGYAIRVSENLIIMPLHVREAAGVGFVLQSHSQKKLCLQNPDVLQSAIHSDLIYISIPRRDLSIMGVTVATLADKIVGSKVSPMVDCVGFNGRSSGRISMYVNHPSMYRYEGSTVPGYSGAGYSALNRVYGMHVGATQDEYDANLGIASWPIKEELKFVIQQEAGGLTMMSSDFSYPDQEIYHEMEKKAKDTVSSMLHKKYGKSNYEISGPSWADEVEEELGDYETEAMESTAVKDLLAKYSSLTGSERKAFRKFYTGVSYVGHSGDEPMVDSSVDESFSYDEMLEIVENIVMKNIMRQVDAWREEVQERFEEMRNEILSYKARVASIERRLEEQLVKKMEQEPEVHVAPVENKPEPAEKQIRVIKCEKCNRLFKERVHMLIHMDMKHAGNQQPISEVYVAESAFRTHKLARKIKASQYKPENFHVNNTKTVKTKTVNFQKQASNKMRSTISKPNLKLSEECRESPVDQQRSRSGTQNSRTQKFFSTYAKATAGHQQAH